LEAATETPNRKGNETFTKQTNFGLGKPELITLQQFWTL